MVIDNGNPICFSFSYDNTAYRFICLPILKVAEDEIIHEINQALTENLLTKNVSFSKSGLEVSDEETNINELINERVSFDICRIFTKHGGNFSKIKLVTVDNFIISLKI